VGHTLDIGRRSVDILLDESTDGNLLRVFVLAEGRAALPDDAHPKGGACSGSALRRNQFDPQLMKCLYDEGRGGRSGTRRGSRAPLEDGGP
jgi:hypothetical protein